MQRKWWTLIAVSVATFMLLLDITVVNTALPAIEEDLNASFTDLRIASVDGACSPPAC
jgi:MFS family permease